MCLLHTASTTIQHFNPFQNCTAIDWTPTPEQDQGHGSIFFYKRAIALNHCLVTAVKWANNIAGKLFELEIVKRESLDQLQWTRQRSGVGSNRARLIELLTLCWQGRIQMIPGGATFPWIFKIRIVSTVFQKKKMLFAQLPP